MYWKIGLKLDDHGKPVIFYNYFEITPCDGLVVKTVGVHTEVEFLEWYIVNKKL